MITPARAQLGAQLDPFELAHPGDLRLQGCVEGRLGAREVAPRGPISTRHRHEREERLEPHPLRLTVISRAAREPEEPFARVGEPRERGAVALAFGARGVA